MSDKVLIFGSTGQLGSDLVSVLQESGKFEVIPLRHEDADVRDADAVRKVVQYTRPQIVINSAAYVRVDDCEDNATEAFAINAIGAHNIARASAEVDSLSVYISTDYVFDGEKETPYVESDQPNPINVYGTSKLAGELLVRQSASRWLIVRVSSLFGKTGARGKGGNFIETILAKAKRGEPLKVVDDIRISPTYTRDAAKNINRLLQSDHNRIIHSANNGSCTWYEFAKVAVEFSGVSGNLNRDRSESFFTRARRPKNSMLLSTPSSHAFVVAPMPFWENALCDYLVERGHASQARLAEWVLGRG